MAKREVWQCRHGVDLKLVGTVGECSDCVVAAQPRGENLVVGMAAMLNAHVRSVYYLVNGLPAFGDDSSGVARYDIADRVDSLFASMMVASAHASSFDAPSCQVEFPVARAGRILGGHRHDPRALADVKTQLADAASVSADWVEAVKKWARDATGSSV